MSESYIKLFRWFCTFNEWRLPTSFYLQSPTSSALFPHSRLAFALILLISKEQLKQFVQFFPSRTESIKVSLEYWNSIYGAWKSTKSSSHRTYWCLSHHDRTTTYMDFNVPRTSLADILYVLQTPTPNIPVNVNVRIQFNCDPERFPNHVPLEAAFCCAFRVHAKKASKFDVPVKNYLWSLLDEIINNVQGKIDLDRTELSGTWQTQKDWYKIPQARQLQRNCYDIERNFLQSRQERWPTTSAHQSSGNSRKMKL